MGTFSILNNISALNGQHQLNLNNINLNRTLNRMASGMRINTGADDAAGLQIADCLRANVFALNQAIRNAGDGISFLQIADGALSEMTNMLTRMVTLAEQAANEPTDARGREALNNEFQELQAEIARVAVQTNFNGSRIFDRSRDFGETLDLFVSDLSSEGANSGYINVKVGYIDVIKKINAYVRSDGMIVTEPPPAAPVLGTLPFPPQPIQPTLPDIIKKFPAPSGPSTHLTAYENADVESWYSDLVIAYNALNTFTSDYTDCNPVTDAACYLVQGEYYVALVNYMDALFSYGLLPEDREAYSDVLNYYSTTFYDYMVTFTDYRNDIMYGYQINNRVNEDIMNAYQDALIDRSIADGKYPTDFEDTVAVLAYQDALDVYYLDVAAYRGNVIHFLNASSGSTNSGQVYGISMSNYLNELTTYMLSVNHLRHIGVQEYVDSLPIWGGFEYTGGDEIDKIQAFGVNQPGELTSARLYDVHLLTHESAAGALVHIKASLDAIATMRGNIGAGINRLQAAISVIQTQSRNTLSAESQIRDANMAEEITSMTRYQILAQTGIASLAHSNTNSQIVLRLLQ